MRKYEKVVSWGTRIHTIWLGIISRCYNKKCRIYKFYGGRGIHVCDEWKNDIMLFYDWAVSNGYADNLTIDRIDNDGDYEPSNCRWVNRKQQANNRRSNTRLTLNGETHTLSEWGDITGISSATLWNRKFKCKWSDEKTLTAPCRHVTRLTKKQINDIMVDAANGIKIIEIAKKYNINRHTVSSAISRACNPEKK